MGMWLLVAGCIPCAALFWANTGTASTEAITTATKVIGTMGRIFTNNPMFRIRSFLMTKRFSWSWPGRKFSPSADSLSFFCVGALGVLREEQGQK